MSLLNDATILRVEEMDLTAAQDAAIAELVGRIFNADMGGQSFAQNRHHRRYMVFDDAQLAAHLAVCFRAIRLGDELVNIVGIAEVVVDRPYRRQGLASRLLDAALEDGERSLADFALLFGTENLYRKAGFKNAPNKITLAHMHNARTREITRKSDPTFMVRKLGEKQWNDSAAVDLAGFAF